MLPSAIRQSYVIACERKGRREGIEGRRGSIDLRLLQETLARKQKFSAVKMILLFLLFLKAAGGQEVTVYVVAGHEAVLPCRKSSCSLPEWIYAPAYGEPVKEAKNGQIVSGSARSHRLALGDDCSLVIRQTRADDAGHFKCDLANRAERVFLTVMTRCPAWLIFWQSPVTWSPWEGHPGPSGGGELKCSVSCWPLPQCRCGDFRWRDGRGRELPTERSRPGYCRSTVPILPGDSAWNYTCQYVRDDQVKIQAWHALGSPSVNPKGPGAGSPAPPRRDVLIGVGATAAVAALLAVLVAVLLKSRRNGQPDVSKHEEGDAAYASVTYERKTESAGGPKDESPEATVTYATVSVKKKTTAEKEEQHPRKQVPKQEAEAAVTYAAVRGVPVSSR
ncbi:uncharacterized protein LOC144183914 [Stigmatopora nigra]